MRQKPLLARRIGSGGHLGLRVAKVSMEPDEWLDCNQTDHPRLQAPWRSRDTGEWAASRCAHAQSAPWRAFRCPPRRFANLERRSLRA